MRADALVLFGATGDLARKKLFPALYHLAAAGRMALSTFTFSSRSESGSASTGGSIASSATTCRRWFWITSRTAPTPS